MLKRILSCVLNVVLILLLCVGCADSEGKSSFGKHPPEYEKLTALIGKTKTEALDTLGLQETDLTEFVEYDYDLPIQVEYAGVQFTPAIQFIHGDEDSLNHINYRAAYKANAEQAAKDMVAVAEQIKKLAGSPDYDVQPGAISTLTEEAILEAITQEKTLSNIDQWDITDSASDSIKDYMKQLGERPIWEIYGEREPRYILSLEISYIAETDTSYIQIRYGILPERYE